MSDIQPGASSAPANPKSRVIAAVLAILLGSFGAHKWYTNRNGAAATMLGITIVGACGAILIIPLFLLIANMFVGVAEGVIYLTRSDAQFEELYVVQKRNWF